MSSIELDEDCWVVIGREGVGVRLVNAVAAFMQSLWQQGLSTDAIVDNVMQRYEVDRETASADLHALLQTLDEDDGQVLKELTPYQPIADFMPAEPCCPVEACECFLPGFRIRFASELPGLCEYLQELFPLAVVPGEPSKDILINVHVDGGRFPVVHEGKTLDTGLTLSDTALKCLREVNGVIGREVPYTIIFHASAVARNGKGILFPALGGSGKTTLSAYLMAQGFEFLNDDAVPLCSQSARLQPIPLSLSIKQGSWSVLDTWFPALTSSRIYGAVGHQIRYLAPVEKYVCRQPVECAMVVLPVYSLQATRLVCEQVSTREAFEHIIRSGCILDQPVAFAQIAALVDWLKALPVYRVTYRDMKEVENWLDAQLPRLSSAW